MPPVDIDLAKTADATTSDIPRDLHDADLAGLDRLELPIAKGRPWSLRLWSALWPKLAATALFLTAWQIVVWSGWKPEYILPGPEEVLRTLGDSLQTADLWEAIRTTMTRAIVGFTVALAIGGVIGIALSRSRVLRVAIGSMLTGLQTMPSVAWFPLAIVLFGLENPAIYFVVVIGAAPSIANGIVAGLDNVPPVLLRVGRSIGAKGIPLYRDVVLPAAMPTIVAGLKQGWAFSWRSLMAGELLVLIPGHLALGSTMHQERELSHYPELLSLMMVVFVIGVIVDAVVFGSIERRLLRNRGLLVERSPDDRVPIWKRRRAADSRTAIDEVARPA
jgi:NitT/TauT family transport system permease protein